MLPENHESYGRERSETTVHAAKLEDINTVLDTMRKGEIEGRMVLEIAKP
jgi:alcohol dehydrogenase, propanol-preferring